MGSELATSRSRPALLLDASYDKKNRLLKSRHRRPRSTLIVILGVLHMYESCSLRWYTWLGSVDSPQKTISSSNLLFFHACNRTLNAITRPGIDRCCVEGGRRPVVIPTYGSQLALPCTGSIDSTSSPVHGEHRQKRSALRHTESHGVYTRESRHGNSIRGNIDTFRGRYPFNAERRPRLDLRDALRLLEIHSHSSTIW